MTTNGDRSDRELVLDELRDASKLLVVTHENPDGDAIGSLVAMRGILSAMGKDCLMFIDAHDLPLPKEYRFFPLVGLVSEPPDDIEQRTVVFLDCGNLDRNPAEAFRRPGIRLLNIDHHHDNTHFGTVNLVVSEASCTAEIIWDLMGGLDVRPSGTIADALYVGLITDTGRFMYENTGRRAHLMAADLIDAGVDVHDLYRRVYEGVPYGKLALLARGLANVERYDDGRLTVTALTRDRLQGLGRRGELLRGRHRPSACGPGDRGRGADPRADQRDGGGNKVSLRASDDRVDVSAIARAQGGGGHRQAAGFTTELSHDELVHFLRDQLAAQL